jgi:lysyl-tRNA synthetase class II
MARAVLLEVKLPPNTKPSAEATEMLIKRFLKECSKESLVQYLYDECAYTRRFTKPSIKERLKRSKYRRNAQKHNLETNSETLEAPKKKKKSQYSEKTGPNSRETKE